MANNITIIQSPDWVQLTATIKMWGKELGFNGIGITDTNLTADELHLNDWLAAGYHGEMAYMARHGLKRSRPAELLPGTIRIITASMNYFPPALEPTKVLTTSALGYIARYALGRDYHKIMRARLEQLAQYITTTIGPFAYRVFSDSAPVLEKALAAKSGLGWIGKHTNFITRHAGSWCFLGEIYLALPLAVSAEAANHCGRCTRCIDACPTGAIIAPYRLDARRCISYLTIELRGAIPVELRHLLGNRIFGCDDCQLACPWNRGAPLTAESGFATRHGLDAPRLAQLMAWSADEFCHHTQGSALRRIGYEAFLRNVAVALGNTLQPDLHAITALRAQIAHPSALVREHVWWALAEIKRKEILN